MSQSSDHDYLSILTGYIQVCAKYKPKLGHGANAGYALDEFQRIYRADNHPKARRKKTTRKESVSSSCKKARRQRAVKEETAMVLYGGMDLHGDNVFCTLMDKEYRPVFERRIPNDLDAVLEALAPYRGRIAKLAVESTYN